MFWSTLTNERIILEPLEFFFQFEILKINHCFKRPLSVKIIDNLSNNKIRATIRQKFPVYKKKPLIIPVYCLQVSYFHGKQYLTCLRIQMHRFRSNIANIQAAIWEKMLPLNYFGKKVPSAEKNICK